jgi:hypothetical protein
VCDDEENLMRLHTPYHSSHEHRVAARHLTLCLINCCCLQGAAAAVHVPHMPRIRGRQASHQAAAAAAGSRQHGSSSSGSSGQQGASAGSSSSGSCGAAATAESSSRWGGGGHQHMQLQQPLHCVAACCNAFNVQFTVALP